MATAHFIVAIAQVHTWTHSGEPCRMCPLVKLFFAQAAHDKSPFTTSLPVFASSRHQPSAACMCSVTLYLKSAASLCSQRTSNLVSCCWMRFCLSVYHSFCWLWKSSSARHCACLRVYLLSAPNFISCSPHEAQDHSHHHSRVRHLWVLQT